MAAIHKIDKERRLVFSSGDGVLTREGIVAYRALLLKDPDFDPTFSQLADFTKYTGTALEPEEIRQLANDNLFSPGSRRAFVVKDDLQFGLARMFEIYRDLKGETGIRVFRSYDEALEWIETGIVASSPDGN